jgi:chloramphenicol 3-O phosphotransferase
MRIIILNGPSSSGKTSIAKQVQQQSSAPYLLTGLDHFIYMMPEKMNDYKGTLKPHEGFGWKKREDEEGRALHDLTPGAYGRRVYDLLFAQVRLFADAGHHVIVDHVTLAGGDYEKWRQNLIDHDVFIVGVTADTDELDRREQARGDRMIGGARAQAEHVHNGFEYDLFLDTTKLPSEQAAHQLLEMLEGKLFS